MTSRYFHYETIKRLRAQTNEKPICSGCQRFKKRPGTRWSPDKKIKTAFQIIFLFYVTSFYIIFSSFNTTYLAYGNYMLKA